MSQFTFQKDVVSLWNNLEYDLPPDYIQKIEDHPFLNFTSGIGKSFYTIGDHFQSKVIYISPAIEDILGYQAADFHDIGTEFVTKIVFEDDHEQMAKGMKQAWELIHAQWQDCKETFVVNHYLRLRRKEGSTLQALFQIFNILTDNNGNILLNKMLFTDISNLNLGNKVMCSLVNTKTKECWVLNVDRDELKRTCAFTKRENEILVLLHQGLNSNQIADKLYLSHHTVRNHRKNMMKKMDVHSTVSLISKACMMMLEHI